MGGKATDIDNYTRRLIRIEEEKSEKLINYWRLGLSFFFFAITALISKEIPRQSTIALYTASTMYFLFSLGMLFYMRAGRYRPGLKFITIFVDIVLLTVLMWLFGTFRTFKTEAYLLYYMWIALGSMRFSFSLTLFSGALCAVGYSTLIGMGLALGTIETGTITESFISPKVSMLNQAVKVTYLILVTVVLSFGSRAYMKLAARARNEQIEAESQRMKAQKLESIGMLAGGIAHDFNNILAIIINNLNIARMQSPEGSKASQHIDKAEAAAYRASVVTRQLLTFAKGGSPIKKSASIEEIVRESMEFSLHGSSLKCVYDFPPGLWNVDVDEGQMHQVFNNLALNSSQASPGGGSIFINARNLPSAQNHAPINTSRAVVITITDQGVGIAPENISKLFDPYFTTKEHGSGLGLAMVYSIISRHGGHIEVESEQGCGTTFRIYLPAHEEQQQSKAQDVSHEQSGESKAPRWNLLIMDDETEFLHSTGAYLRMLGHRADLVEHGAAAIEKYKQAKAAGRPYDAVILDLTVPGGMGGRETLEKLRACDPGVKAIVASGYSNDPVMAHHREFGFRGLLSKPFSMDDLIRVVADTLAIR